MFVAAIEFTADGRSTVNIYTQTVHTTTQLTTLVGRLTRIRTQRKVHPCTGTKAMNGPYGP